MLAEGKFIESYKLEMNPGGPLKDALFKIACYRAYL